jgi:hypothetical protein
VPSQIMGASSILTRFPAFFTDDLVSGLFVDDVLLNNLRAFEYLFNDRSIAGIGEGGEASVYTEVVERCEN